VQDACCEEAAACLDDPDCFDCVTGQGDPMVCQNNAAAADVVSCAQASCEAECFPAPTNACNPVTNAPCNTAAGEACDLSSNGYVCFPAPNDVVCGGTCDNGAGPYCEAGYTCAGGGGTTCARYCCTDADCGASAPAGTCTGAANGSAGVCNDAAMAPVCEMPKPDITTAPSGGSCVTVM
jgi:hypothetical protein